MPDVFYAMKRDVDLSNESETIRRRVIPEHDYRGKNAQSDEYYSTDSTDDDSSDRREATKRGQFEKQQQTLSKAQKFWKRFYSTWIMIFGFFGIIYVGHTALCCFVVVFQVLCEYPFYRPFYPQKINRNEPKRYHFSDVILNGFSHQNFHRFSSHFRSQNENKIYLTEN